MTDRQLYATMLAIHELRKAPGGIPAAHGGLPGMPDVPEADRALLDNTCGSVYGDCHEPVAGGSSCRRHLDEYAEEHVQAWGNIDRIVWGTCGGCGYEGNVIEWQDGRQWCADCE